MRLIDELLKDDFFHGGYQSAASAASGKAGQVSSGAGGKKPMILIAAAVGGLAILGAGGFFFLSSGTKDAPPATQAAEPQKPAETATAQQPAAPKAAETPRAAAIPAPAPVAKAAIPAPAVVPATPPPAPAAPAVVAAVAPPAPVVAKVVVPDMYTLVFPKFSDKEKAEAIIAKLKDSGASPKLNTGSDKTTAFSVKSAKNATAAEAKAIKLKAMIFKVTTTPVPQDDGSVLYDFGTFKTKDEAEAAVASAKKLSHEVAISEEKTSVPVYSIDAGKWPEDQARSNLSALGSDGDGVKVKKVK